MRVNHCAWMIVLLLCSAAYGQEQSFDYGKPGELKGLKKVFVDTGMDTQSRDSIQKALTDSKLGFMLLDSATGAEVILMFRAGAYNKTVGVPQPNGSVMIGQPKIPTGAGYVLIPQSSDRLRLIISFKDEQETAFQKKPVTNFSKTFLKAYKQANGL